MSNIINYAVGNCSKETKRIFDEIQEKAKARREGLEHLDAQIAEGNKFAERYRESLLDGREDELLRSAEILHNALQ